MCGLRYCREIDACAEHFGLKGELLYEESIHSAGNLIGQEVYSDRENNTGMTRVVYVGIEAKNANKSSLVATAPDTYYCIGAQFKNAKNFDVKMNCEDNVALDMQFSKKGQGGGSQSINYENLSCSK